MFGKIIAHTFTWFYLTNIIKRDMIIDKKLLRRPLGKRQNLGHDGKLAVNSKRAKTSDLRSRKSKTLFSLESMRTSAY